MNQVSQDPSKAAKFVEAADRQEAINKTHEEGKTTTAHYMLNFDDIWVSKLPRTSHKNFQEQIPLDVVNFDEGLTNTMWITGTLLIRLKVP